MNFSRQELREQRECKRCVPRRTTSVLRDRGARRSAGIELRIDQASVVHPYLFRLGNWGCVVTTNEIKHVLLWCVGLNYAVLLIWFGVFVFAHEWMYRLHGRWFKLSV